MSAVAGMVAPFLVGAATGGWLSRRRAVGRAVASALASAEGGRAAAMAQGNVVYVSTVGAGESVAAVPSNMPIRRLSVPATYINPHEYDYDEDEEHALIAETRRQLSPAEQRIVDVMLERFNAGAFAPPELGS